MQNNYKFVCLVTKKHMIESLIINNIMININLSNLYKNAKQNIFINSSQIH